MMVEQATDPIIARIKSERGLQAHIGKACGISRQAVVDWVRVPSTRVVTVAKILGIAPHQIRPDVFPKPRATSRRKKGA
jgi:hypothetical protein